MRRIEEGAEKCALRDLRREEETSVAEYQHLHIPKVIQNSGVASSRELCQNAPFNRGARDTSSICWMDMSRTSIVLHFRRRDLEDGGRDEGMAATQRWN